MGPNLRILFFAQRDNSGSIAGCYTFFPEREVWFDSGDPRFASSILEPEWVRRVPQQCRQAAVGL